TFGLFNITGDAGQGAAGTNAGNKDIHFTIGIVPDFRAGGVFVNLRVSGILELLRQEVVVRVGGENFLSLGDGARHTLGGFGQHQFGPQGLENLAPLQAHGGRHGKNQLVTAGSGDVGQRDAGVTTGGLDNGHARFQGAAFFGIPDHGGTNPAFDRIGRVPAFDLGP